MKVWLYFQNVYLEKQMWTREWHTSVTHDSKGIFFLNDKKMILKFLIDETCKISLNRWVQGDAKCLCRSSTTAQWKWGNGNANNGNNRTITSVWCWKKMRRPKKKKRVLMKEVCNADSPTILSVSKWETMRVKRLRKKVRKHSANVESSDEMCWLPRCRVWYNAF